jgi:hypothetical protein
MNASLTLNLTPGQLDRIAQILAKQPWQEVNDLLVLFQQQVQEQQNGTSTGNGRSAGNGRDESAEHTGVGRSG